MNKVQLSDNIQEVVYKISEGNPGALRVIMELLQKDPQFGLIQVLKLDDLGIYGSRIWMLFKDIFRGQIDPLYFAIKHNRLKKVIRRKKLMDMRFAQEWEYYGQPQK